MTQAEEIKTSLVVVFERADKVSPNGDALIARRRFNGLRPDLAPEAVAAIGQAIGAIITGTYTHSEISRDYALLNA
ncbi:MULTISPECIES: DUF1659 domain-containing protein [unclassified Exiguobacterium]|uniref:DUF1659 domain-containing protein n=1 Tax=unclassified Exiguobacterium TaxID=2644629 RepID=UPI001BE89A9F|nr:MULTISPECIES: DUF1659 domain-containing protein [unclassified Exiguobacterium]